MNEKDLAGKTNNYIYYMCLAYSWKGYIDYTSPHIVDMVASGLTECRERSLNHTAYIKHLVSMNSKLILTIRKASLRFSFMFEIHDEIDKMSVLI